MEAKIFTGKTVDDAITKALIELETSSNKINYEVIDKGSTGILGIGSKPAKISVTMNISVEDVVVDFLAKVFRAMNMDVKMRIRVTDEEVDINLEGDDMGLLIGKRGQTLDSLQYLLSLVVNKKSENYLRVKVDTENYRQRRQETLENLAKNIAYKVSKTRRPVSLEPMNPYERRIIHSALQDNKYVTTKSEGEEPYRHVVVILNNNK